MKSSRVTAPKRKAPKQTRIYIRKVERTAPLKDTYLQIRVTREQADGIKRILQQRGTTLTEYLTKIINYEIDKDMNKNQYTLLEMLEQK